jgi:hypothetical protein
MWEIIFNHILVNFVAYFLLYLNNLAYFSNVYANEVL